ncbi:MULTISPECIES: dermonecrotic toxin domain-containing protein [Pseudomonas]|uniref:Dermonecrotic toxin N-terminal domain-containing protein n=1 Tax=Pseudomonas urmiensis TaxID=2745493 RepID=A0A923FZ04_9PSED|nr:MULTISPECIES: DUF6543 domain-containing protein [Pseudomonas]MBV4537480.1 hypothetical protein [Pseudomonas urmiensis]
MNGIKDKKQRQLQSLDVARSLMQVVGDFLRDYPDPYVLARKHAARIVLKHTGKAIDPRFVWWHRFETSSSSRRSFNGWQHSGPPVKSVTLTELVVERFELRFQDASDELDLYGGFYKQGPQAAHFDERNEVRMLGSAVQQDLWALDFAEVYRAEVAQFWATQTVNVQVLAKINLLGECVKAVRAGRISPADATTLRAMAADGLESSGQLPSLLQLRQDSTSGSLAVSRYALGRGDNACIYSFRADSGRVLLYLPWSTEALRAFDSELAMAGWLRGELKSTHGQQGFLSNLLTNPRDKPLAELVRATLQAIANSRSDQAALALLALQQVQISQDIFVYLAAQARAQMQDSAAIMLDNAGLREAMWSGYLAAFLNVFGGFAPLGWPVTLVLLGAAVAKLGLGLDIALHAPSEEARKAALRDALLDSLFAALNMADLGFQSSYASLAYQAPFHEADASLSQWTVCSTPEAVLAGKESNALSSDQRISSGRLSGLRVTPDGACWIMLRGLSYRVRYSHELSVWLIVPADKPFAFGPLLPVRQNDFGEWELLEPPRLLGGSPPPVTGIPSRTSALWDEYMKTHGVRSKHLSAQARARHKKILLASGIPSLSPEVTLDVDSHGLSCVMLNGKAQYSFRYEGGEFVNFLIEYYTDEESQINQVFREGVHRYDDCASYIDDLADTLESLPKSNAVTLYRGGHGGRGTSGEHFRRGQLSVGDVLVNTDMTSFTENPYLVRQFASSSTAGEASGLDGSFDDTSVVFELPEGRYQSGTPISAFSMYWDEAETLFLPGHYFRIDRLEQVYGDGYRFIHVSLSQIDKPAAGSLYDMRTGELFERAAYTAKVKSSALVERFFPVDTQ